MRFIPDLSRKFRTTLTITGLTLALSGCLNIAVTPEKPPIKSTLQRSPESLRLEKYYASVLTHLKAQGLMRTDGGEVDAPFSAQTLADDFSRIALFDEYAVAGGQFVARQTPSRLRRWEKPVRIGLTFGDLVPMKTRAKDRADVISFARRLARISGHDIQVTDKNPNFHVLFRYRDELKNIGPEIRKMEPRIAPIVVREISNSPRSTFCVAYAFSDPGKSSAYTSAIILIKAEHTGLMRLSCIHEEMTQALGLANDSPIVRPSIFNDDEEFALLTRHDELLLKMLYDPRLKLGMTSQSAHAILPVIAKDVMNGRS